MMSFTSSVLIIFYLCACSLHACNARLLGLIGNGGFGKQLYFPSKVVDHEVKGANMDSTKTGAAYSGDSIGNYNSHGGAMISTQKPKGMKYSTEEEEEEAIPGNKTGESSSHMKLLKATGVEDPRWQSSGRAILEHESHGREEEEEEEEEEVTYSSPTYYNNDSEDAQLIDYEPPHNKTPVHN
ncbi:hypothetical protein Vadar_012177 [Vaccinium darrowii]|uniref:Uncharacterized protein n=1 Tax=Vaccinium darrowii TaxID=229202 RepID=A0ACB7YN56_9ERIC|nr:hypothetical protein Vadar_012177 [Vaccinium darrowii]